MYVLIDGLRLPEDRHYEKMPDGRCIVSGREARMLGRQDGVTIVPNAAVLQEMIAQQEAERKNSVITDENEEEE